VVAATRGAGGGGDARRLAENPVDDDDDSDMWADFYEGRVRRRGTMCEAARLGKKVLRLPSLIECARKKFRTRTHARAHFRVACRRRRRHHMPVRIESLPGRNHFRVCRRHSFHVSPHASTRSTTGGSWPRVASITQSDACP
jgi:hypothetical protein